MSSIIFKPEKDIDKFKLIFDAEAYIKPKNKVQEIDIFVNGIFKKRIIFNENLKRNKSLSIDIKNLYQDFVLVEFYITNPKSPFDILESVDTRSMMVTAVNARFVVWNTSAVPAGMSTTWMANARRALANNRGPYHGFVFCLSYAESNHCSEARTFPTLCSAR